MFNWKRLFLLGFGLLLVILFAACNESADDQKVAVDSGDVIYKNSCASCHGDDLAGSTGPALENISSRYTDEEIKDIINHGTGTMFPVNLKEEIVDELVDWLMEQ